MFDVSTVLKRGKSFVVRRTLTEADTAAKADYGCKNLGYLIGTHVYLEMMIDAALGVIGGDLPEGLSTVGRSMEIYMDAPSCPGMTLSMKATLKEIDGDHLLFETEAWDDCGHVGHGRHERTVVNLEKLFERANQRLLKKA